MKTPVFVTTALLSTLAAVQAYPFTNSGTIHPGPMEQWLCAADMDRNGRPDIVCAETSGYIYILKPDGQGGYAKSPLATVTGYRSVNGAAADLNRDGRMDFVVYLQQGTGSSSPARCAVLLQKDDGTFKSPVYYLPAGATAADNGPLTISDMDRDGRPDIVMGWTDPAASGNRGRVSWFRNKGDGTFDAPTAFFLATFARLSAVASGDFNQDGHMDVAVGDGALSEVKIFPGPAFFSGVTTISNVTKVRQLIAVDTDLDGRLDLFSLGSTADPGYRKLQRLKNSASGWTTQELASEPAGPFSSLACADLDADRRPDPVYIGGSATQCTIGMTRPVWGSYTDGMGPVASLNMNALALADCDGDGDKDLFATGSSGVILQKNIAPHAVWRRHYNWAESSGQSGSAALASADFNGDGYTDIASASSSDGKLRWFQMGTDGRPETPVTIASIAGISSVAVGDIDRDGDTDIVCPSIAAGKILWFANNDGTSWTQNTISHSFGLPTWVRTTDFDGDGDMDIVLAKEQPAPGIHLLTNENKGQSWAMSTLRMGSAGQFELADVIPGGAPELVSKSSDNSVNLTYYDSTAQTWKTSDLGGDGELTRGLALGDTDGDGDLDIVTGTGSRVLHIRQTGPNQWAPPVELANITGVPTVVVRSLQVADCNLDGRAEILCASRNGVRTINLNADGTGTVVPAMVESGGSDYGDILAGHFNMDGIPDVACATVLSGIAGELRMVIGDIAQADLNFDPVMAQSSGHRGRIVPGRKAAVMKFNYQSYGWSGDASTRPHHIKLKFRRADTSAVLNYAEMTGLFERVALVRDTVNPGIYDPVGDAVVHTISYFEDAGDIMFTASTYAIPPGEGAAFFLVVTPQDSAASAPVKDVNIELPIYLNYDADNDTNAVTTNTSPEGVRLRLRRMGGITNLSLGTMTPIQQWRFSHWGDPYDQGPGANNADPDHDGIANLIEYACNGLPNTREPHGGAAFMMRKPVRVLNASYLDFAIGTRPDISIAVQYTGWPYSSWYTLSQRDGTGPWSVPGVIFQGTTIDYRTWFSVRHDTTASRQYYRLKVTELAP